MVSRRFQRPYSCNLGNTCLLCHSKSAIFDQESSGTRLTVMFHTSNPSASIILRGANDYMLDEMERALHDTLSIIKRTLESGSVVPGGGAVESALSIYLENFAMTLVRPLHLIPVVDFTKCSTGLKGTTLHRGICQCFAFHSENASSQCCQGFDRPCHTTALLP